MVDDDLKHAIQLIKDGKLQVAEQILKNINITDPFNIRAWLWQTETQNTIEGKIKILEDCLQKNPEEPLVIKGLAKLRNDQELQENNLFQSKSSIIEPTKGNLSETPNASVKMESLQNNSESLKPCPFCAEMIQEKANVCRFCGKDLSRISSYTKDKSTNMLGLTQGETKILIGGVFIAIIACIIGLIILRGGVSTEFNSNLNSFLVEGEKLTILTKQGVTNSDFRNQLAEVKSAYSLLNNSWPSSLISEKDGFANAIRAWDLTLEIWDGKIDADPILYHSLNQYDESLYNECEAYANQQMACWYFDDAISILMETAGKYFETGKASLD